MWSGPQYCNTTYMGGTVPCYPIRVIFGIFGSVIQSCYTSENIKFGVNTTFYMPKTSVYRLGLYGRYRTLWTDEHNFCYGYLELVQKPKYQSWCEADVPCAEDPCFLIPSAFIYFIYMGSTGRCGPMSLIFTSLSTKFGANRKFQYTYLTYVFPVNQ